MRALFNILGDLAFQFRLRGALAQRLRYVALFYRYYFGARREGLSREESRMRAQTSLARQGYVQRRVEVTLPGRIRMETDIQSACFMSKEFVADRMYESLRGFAPSAGQTVVDVGAHHGFFSLRAAARVGPKGRVLAVEASPENLPILRRNLEANGFSWATVVGAAAGGSAGTVSFHIPETSTAGSLVFTPEGSRAVAVQMKTLDQILAEAGISRVDLVKIDVEGACLAVLRGAGVVLDSKPRLVMEVEGGAPELGPVLELLERRGYRHRIDNAILYAEAA